MQEGTSIGLMTVVAIVGFGILFGILVTFMPQMRQLAILYVQMGVDTPTP